MGCYVLLSRDQDVNYIESAAVTRNLPVLPRPLLLPAPLREHGKLRHTHLSLHFSFAALLRPSRLSNTEYLMSKASNVASC